MDAASRHDFLVTVEENALAGGAGSGVNEILAAAGVVLPVLNIGLDDSFIEHGSREECLRQARLDSAGIQAQIDGFLQLLRTSAALNPAFKIKA
jgi:1-deoxy-D-xylulose-5-phosphate synthase